MRLEFVLPLRTVPGLNAREHWAVRAKRVKHERQSAKLLSKFAAKQLRNLEHFANWTELYPLTITLTRLKPRGPQTDDDNLQGAMKAIRDGVADALEINDGDTTVAQWRYGQEKGRWGVRVLIETQPEAPDLGTKGNP